MQKNKKLIATIGTIAVIILIVWFVAHKKKALAPADNQTTGQTEQTGQTTTPDTTKGTVSTTPSLTPEQSKAASDANDLGIKKSGAGDYAGAVAAFKKAHEIAPGDPRFVRNLAIAYSYTGDYTAAEAMFKLDFTGEPTHPEYWLELGELYSLKMKDSVKADAFYLQAMKVSNNDISVAQAYANFLETQKRYSDAIHYWQIVADGTSQNKTAFLAHIEELKAKIH